MCQALFLNSDNWKRLLQAYCYTCTVVSALQKLTRLTFTTTYQEGIIIIP